MSHASPPPGWYLDGPQSGVLRWWDGTAWTEHIQAHEATSPEEDVETNVTAQVSRARATVPRNHYWENLVRLRYWWFTLGGALVLSVLAGLVLPVLTVPLFFVLVPLLGWFWLRVQMACRRCGTLLAAAKVSGTILVCPKCGSATDEGLRRKAGELGGQ